eukprot:1686683-Amphidinium_carterae.1
MYICNAVPWQLSSSAATVRTTDVHNIGHVPVIVKMMPATRSASSGVAWLSCTSTSRGRPLSLACKLKCFT